MKIGSSFNRIYSQLLHKTSRSPPHDSPSNAERTRSSPTAQSVYAQLQTLLSNIDLNTEHGLKEARREFVQVILATRFGNTLVNDPRFVVMVDNIETEIASDKELMSDFDSALRELNHS